MMQLDIVQDVLHALQEDIGSGDVTATLLPKEQRVTAEIITREPLLVCGQAWVNMAFALVAAETQVEWLVHEGVWCTEPSTLCYIHGLARDIVTAERTALNFLQVLSGTATQVAHYVQLLKGSGARLLDTRKTLPGLRRAQKYAVRCAGGVNHRMGLYDAYLIKENHIASFGSITKVIQYARTLQPS